MSNYTPKDKWHPQIRQFDINEIVEGGEVGLDNIPHQQLADCLFHLKKRIENIETKGGTITVPNAPTITTTDQGTGSGLVYFNHNDPTANGQSIQIVQTIKHGSGCAILTDTTKAEALTGGQATIGFAKPDGIALQDICEVRYIATNTVSGVTTTIVVQGSKSGVGASYPKNTIDIVGYKDGDYNASHFQGESLKVNLTNAQNGHEVLVTRSAQGLDFATTNGWGNDGSGVVKWGTADIKGIHAKLYSAERYQQQAQNMYTMTYVARDNATIGSAQEAWFLRKVRGAAWKTRPKDSYQTDAAFYGFGETVKLTDDTVDIYFVAAQATRAQSEGKELTISLFSTYKKSNSISYDPFAAPASDRPSSVDVIRAIVTNGIAHFPNVPIPKKTTPLDEGEKIGVVYYEVGTPDIPYAGDGTGFSKFDSTATTSICRGQLDYSKRYITEQIEGLNL